MVVAVRHQQLDTLPTLPSHSGRHVQWANMELASALFVAKSRPYSPDGMVWYGMAITYPTER